MPRTGYAISMESESRARQINWPIENARPVEAPVEQLTTLMDYAEVQLVAQEADRRPTFKDGRGAGKRVEGEVGGRSLGRIAERVGIIRACRLKKKSTVPRLRSRERWPSRSFTSMPSPSGMQTVRITPATAPAVELLTCRAHRCAAIS